MLRLRIEKAGAMEFFSRLVELVCEAAFDGGYTLLFVTGKRAAHVHWSLGLPE